MIPCSCSAHHTLCPCLPCIIRTLAQQVAEELPNATDRLESAFSASRPTDGLRSASFDGSNRHGTGGHSDPVLDTVEAHDTRTRSTVNVARSHMDDCTDALRKALSTLDDQERRQYLEDARYDLTEALRILHRLLKPEQAEDPRPTSAGCASCRRIKDSHGRPFFSDTRTKGSTYCRGCEDWKRDTGDLPPLGVVEMWRDGIRLTAPRVALAEQAERERMKPKRKRRKAS